MDKTLGRRGEALIKEFEGLRLHAYADQAGVWTIGWGHTRTAKPGQAITEATAQRLFVEDVAGAVAAVNALQRARGAEFTQAQFDALVSFHYNTGALGNRRNGVTRAVLELRDDDVDDEMLRWDKITQPGTGRKVVSRGLKRRRHAEAALWIEGSAPAIYTNERQVQAAIDATATPVAPPSGMQQAASSPAVQGSAIATASTVLATASDGIAPLAHYSDTLRIVFVVLALVGVALAVYGATRASKGAAA